LLNLNTSLVAGFKHVTLTHAFKYMLK